MMWRVKKFWKDLQRDFIPAQKAFWGTKRGGKKSPLKKGVLPAAGRGARIKLYETAILVSVLLGMLLGVLVLVIVPGILVFLTGIKPGAVIFILGVVIGVFVAVPVLIYQTDDYALGARGEAAVAEELDKLGRPQWRIFHSVDTGRGDIDHIIVCPKGVFCVETKTLRKVPSINESISFSEGMLWRVNKYGSKRKEDSDPIPQVRRNADWLRKYLAENTGGEAETPVASVIAFPGWWVKIEDGHRDENLIPCNPEQIGGIFAKRADKLSNKRIETICAALAEKNRVDIGD